MRRMLALAPVVLFFLESSGQTDTIVNGVRYNFISYYPDGKINELGNVIYKDTLQTKNGRWIKFDKTGKELESGKFHNSEKTGKWIEGDCTGEYKHGKKQGWWKCPSKKNKYKNGEFVEKVLIDSKVF